MGVCEMITAEYNCTYYGITKVEYTIKCDNEDVQVVARLHGLDGQWHLQKLSMSKNYRVITEVIQSPEVYHPYASEI